MRSGVIKSFRVHPSWLQVPWQGKVTDLSQAYKQLFVSLKDRWAAVISVFDPNSIPTRSEQNFLQVSLPFGARGSVNPLYRASRLFWAVGLDIGLIWLNFFDDYPTFCPSNVNHVAISYQTPIQFAWLAVCRQSGKRSGVRRRLCGPWGSL